MWSTIVNDKVYRMFGNKVLTRAVMSVRVITSIRLEPSIRSIEEKKNKVLNIPIYPFARSL